MSRLPHYCPVCAYHNWNLDGLVEMIWEYLDLLRIYTKPKVGLGTSPMMLLASLGTVASSRHRHPATPSLEC